MTSLDFLYGPEMDKGEFAEDMVKGGRLNFGQNVRPNFFEELLYVVQFHLEADRISLP